MLSVCLTDVTGLHHRLDVQIKPRVAESAFKLPPHGIVGQGWDGDDKAIDGEQDVFPKTGEFTTCAVPCLLSFTSALPRLTRLTSSLSLLTPHAPPSYFLFWQVIGGVLPLSLFCGGHNYFVSQFAQRNHWEPYSIHTTYQ